MKTLQNMLGLLHTLLASPVSICKYYCKYHSFPRRGGNPFTWIFKRVLAEWRFQCRRVDAASFVCFLCGDSSKESLSYWEEAKSVPVPLLYVLVRTLRPTVVVETGVQAGRTTVSILQALQDLGGGRLYSIDKGERGYCEDGLLYTLPREKIGHLVTAELKDYCHLILGDARYELPRLLHMLGGIDLFLHDSLHTEEHMNFEYEVAWSFLKEGGCLLSDDISVSFANFARRVGRGYVCTKLVLPMGMLGGIRK